MARGAGTHQSWNLWKIAALGMGLVLATALATGVVVANYVGKENATMPEQPVVQQPAAKVPPPPPVAQQPVAKVPPPPAQHARIEPSTGDVEACNQYARSVSEGKTKETITDGLIGGAVGAGLGAAGGAIAGGGHGAGKGAGIGALVGAAGGTLYGLNDANRSDARAAEAYRACMRRHGYSD